MNEVLDLGAFPQKLTGHGVEEPGVAVVEGRERPSVAGSHRLDEVGVVGLRATGSPRRRFTPFYPAVREAGGVLRTMPP